MESTHEQYILDYNECLREQQKYNLKISCYATIIYNPAHKVIDFGIPTWPPTLLKKEVSARVLLVSTWTDGRWGLIGGGCRKDESPVQAICREFEEETGYRYAFSESNFQFGHITEKRATFTFCAISHDLSFFNSILAGFYSIDRRAYPDEVLAICGYPIWVEGPSSISEVSWDCNIFGFARHLVSNGGFMTPTLGM